MKMNYSVNTSPQFRVLSEDQIEEIFYTALDVLEQTGAFVYHEEAIDLFKHSDAVVTSDKKVRIPISMVEQALNFYPRKITLSGRDGKRTTKLQKDTVSFGTGSDLPFCYDRETGERRSTTYNDVKLAARIVDNLPNYDFFMSHGIVRDAPNPQTYDRHQFLAMLEQCRKPMVLTSVDGEGLQDLWRMGCVIKGGEDEFRLNPLFVVYIEPISPLKNDRTAVEKLLFAAEKGIPAMYTPCPSAGATAPASMAGMLVQSLAETLLAVVLCHLKKPGMPLIMGGVTTVLDMKKSTYSYGAPELSLASAANTDIAKWLGLLMFSTGGCTDSKVLDEQAGAEMMTSLFYSNLSGANLVHDVGYIDSGTNASLESLVLNDEMIGMSRQFCKGIKVDEESLALDLIEKQGPGGEYVTTEHTFEHWKDWYLPKLQDRSDYETWVSNGSKSMNDRVKERTQDIIDNHRPEEISKEKMKEIKKIVEDADHRHS